MSRFRRAFYYLRVLLLVSLFCGAYVLHTWSRDQDPRFFRFLVTPPGRMLAKLFNWEGLPMDQVVREKSERDMTPEERRIKAELERQMADLLPRHLVTLADGKEMYGTVIEETPDRVLFRQGYGDSASIETTFARSQVRSIAPSGRPVPKITYRDIRFSMEFPELRFYKVPPYTFLTEASYLDVVDAVEELQLLYRQFQETFGALVDKTRLHDDLQVLSFGDEKRFRSYQQRIAPGLDHTVGFYAPSVDRFVMFNQARGSDVLAWQESVQHREAAYREKAEDAEDERRISEWRQQADRRIAGIAAAQNRATLRHEASHQLLFTFGVHSWHRAENDWLVEGLATYCETRNFGDIDANRLLQLRHALRSGSLSTLKRLLSYKIGEFGKLESSERISVAYGQSWSLVHFLMQQQYRKRFFEYMLYVRDPRNLEVVRNADPLDLLARFVGLSPAEIERRWKAYVDGLSP